MVMTSEFNNLVSRDQEIKTFYFAENPVNMSISSPHTLYIICL